MFELKKFALDLEVVHHLTQVLILQLTQLRDHHLHIHT